MMIVSFSCVFRNLKRTYQASNLSDEFEKKRKCNAYRKEKRELPLFLSLYLCLCLFLIFSLIHIPRQTLALLFFAGRFWDSCRSFVR